MFLMQESIAAMFVRTELNRTCSDLNYQPKLEREQANSL